MRCNIIPVHFTISKRQVLVHMWRNWNPYTMLVGMYNCETSMKNSMPLPQKLHVELPLYDPLIAL